MGGVKLVNFDLNLLSFRQKIMPIASRSSSVPTRPIKLEALNDNPPPFGGVRFEKSWTEPTALVVGPAR